MNFPNLAFWWRLLATVGAEVFVVVALGFVAQRAICRADWQRAICQMTVISVLVVMASEWTGLGRGMAKFLAGQRQTVGGAAVREVKSFKYEVAIGRLTPALNRPSAPLRPAVWWPGCIWLAGLLIVLGRVAVGQSLLLVLRWRSEKIVSGALQERVLHVAKSVGLRRKICLLRMRESISPMAFGILRPGIGLPLGFEARFSAAEQEAILAHELAHLAAMDPLWFLMADFVGAWLWWHPLAWWVRRSLHVSSELAADEAAALVPDGPDSLAKCLVALGKEMTARRGWGWVGINGGFRSKLGNRVERLMGMSGGMNRPLAGWTGAAARIAATILIVPTVVLLFGAFQSVEGQREGNWRESWNNSPGALLMLAALATDDVDVATSDRQKILSQLCAIRLDKVEFDQPLTDVLDRLHIESQKFDPDGVGIRFLIKPHEDVPEGAIAVGADHSAVDMSTVTIKISPPLSNLRLIDVVNAITMVADHPIEYAVEDHAVVFSPKLDEAAPLYAKVFHVAPNTFVENLRSMNRALLAPGKPAGIDGIEMDDRARLSRDGHDDFGGPAASRVRSNYVTKTNDTIQLDQMVRAYFTAAGVNLTDPGKSIYFNDRAGLILARASARELQIIQQAVDDLSQPQPQATVMAKSEPPRPQVVITANYIEADEALLQRLMIDWTESSRETTGIMTKGFATHHAETRPAKEFTGIMTEAQYHSALAAMTLAAANGGYEVDSSSMGKLTNDVGQAACAIWGDDNHVTLDYVSTVGLDGLFSVETTAALTVKTGDHTWQVSASRSLSDGQTLVIGGVMTNQFSKAGKARMVFITPRIIDPAGNPVHTDEELSGKH